MFKCKILCSNVKFFRRKNSRDRQSFSLERRKDREGENDCGDYEDDKFEVESDKSASETGTYTVDQEAPSPIPASLQEPRLSCLASNKTSYVEEWATKHAFSVSRKVLTAVQIRESLLRHKKRSLLISL